MPDPTPAPRPAAFLDRDGVLIADTGYPHAKRDIVWMQGAAQAVRRLNQAGYLVFVITNQSGVARGFYPEQAVIDLHRWMEAALQAQGARIDAFAYCPHHPQAAIPSYRRICDCRKPAPGMITRLMNQWPVRRAGSFVIGDRALDIEAATAAGLPGLLFAGTDLDACIALALANGAHPAEP